MKKITFVIASVLMWTAGLGAADLPVRQVILYKHGVGFFQRSGELRAGDSARLARALEEADSMLVKDHLADGQIGCAEASRPHQNGSDYECYFFHGFAVIIRPTAR